MSKDENLELPTMDSLSYQKFIQEVLNKSNTDILTYDKSESCEFSRNLISLMKIMMRRNKTE